MLCIGPFLLILLCAIFVLHAYMLKLQLPTLSDLLSKDYSSLTERDKNRMRKLDRKAKLKGSNDLLEQ
jgi:hypothetical protein